MNGPLRLIFTVAILLMWVLFGLALSQGSWTPLQWAMLGVAHIVCAIVFRNFAYVFSYGYAISLLAINLIVVATLPSVASSLVAGCGILYGLRLWHFVHTRQRDSSFKAVRERSDAVHGKTPIGAKAGVWIMVSWLMAFHPMTAYNVARAARLDVWIVVGVAIMLAGLILEALADAQKLAAKRADASTWVSAGLYRRMRHPNYLGEIIFQIGLIVAGLGAAAGPWATVAGVVAPLYVVFLMYYAARDLDAKQTERYGTSAEYRAYRDATGMLTPG